MIDLTTRRQLLAGALAMLSARQARGQGVPPTSAEPPQSIDLSYLCTTAKDQGSRDTCAYFALIAAAEAILHRDFGRNEPLSEQYLIDCVQKNWQAPQPEGINVADLFEATQPVGLMPQAAWPYRPNRFPAGTDCNSLDLDARMNMMRGQNATPLPASCFLPPPPLSPALLAMAARLRIDQVRVPSQVVTSVNWQDVEPGRRLLKYALAQLGVRKTPLIVNLKMPFDGEGWGDDGLVRPATKMRQQNEAQLDAIPNHYVLITGYDRATAMFSFKNSRGTAWGQNGYGRISFADLASPFCAEVPYSIDRLAVS